MDIKRLRPKDTPKLRQEVVANTRRDIRTGPDDLPGDSLEAMEGITSMAEDAPAWWVSEDMTKTAQAASLDLGRGPFSVSPETGRGIVFFSGGLPPYSVAMPNFWADVVKENPHMEGSSGDVPIGFFWIFSKEQIVFSLIGPSPSGGYILAGFDFIPIKMTLLNSNEAVYVLDNEFGEDGAYHAILAAMWSLSQTPTVAELSTHTPATGPKIKGQRRRQAPSPIKVVELRQMKHQTVTHSSSGRQYTHRWIVRGHWRDQACGPGLKQRRRTWVPAYTKGPDGAPLLEKETVFAWKR